MSGRVALVTGSSSGIGKATAELFAARGARLVRIDVNPVETGERGESLDITCDVSDETQVRAACESAIAAFGRLDVIVNVAGIMTFKPLVDLEAGDWTGVLAVNLLGPAYFARWALQHMSAGSSIVNVASVHALRTSENVAPYAAAKAALCSLTRSVAIEGKPLGIRANAILPGAIDTPMLRDSPNIRSGAETIRLEDIGQPRDVAGAAVYLASDEAAFVTGASLLVDGGRLAAL